MTVTRHPATLPRLAARLATGSRDIEAAQRLRHLCFVERAGRAPLPQSRDSDRFDALCRHVVIEQDGALVGTFRFMVLTSGARIGQSYSAQYYDLGRLLAYPRPLVELGRFCLHPDAAAGDALRLALGALTRIVDHAGAGMLFGCSSFAGTDPAPYRSAFAYLAARHQAPGQWRPEIKAPHTMSLATGDQPGPEALPPLLRSYLALGGWVSDHAVIDHAMSTLHVFTGVETDRVPPRRAEGLRQLSAHLLPDL